MTDIKIEAAHQRMTATAARLAQALGDIEAAGLLVGAAVGVLLATHDDEFVIGYLRAFAAELEADGDGSDEGGAVPLWPSETH